MSKQIDEVMGLVGEPEYYVYGCYSSGKLVYVGSGKGDRYLHCESGTSSCGLLNRDYWFGAQLETKMLHTGLTKSQSLRIERQIIESTDGLYNKIGVSREKVASPYSCEVPDEIEALQALVVRLRAKAGIKADGSLKKIRELTAEVKKWTSAYWAIAGEKLQEGK